MATRDLSLTVRSEGTRTATPVSPPVQFSLQQIKGHFDESLSGIKNQYDIASSLETEKNDGSEKVIWRSQVVLAEGLLDFYLHEISKYCLFRMFSGSWAKTDKYSSFSVPMSRVEDAITSTESKDWFFEYLNDRFSRDVFLSLESMKDLLNMIGVGFPNAMGRAFPCDTENESVSCGKKVIQELFRRRNEIAHQNDRSHSTAEQTDISEEFVKDYIGKIESIVNAIHQIVEEKDSNI